MVISELDQNDPWHLYGPPLDPRMLFVLAEGHVSSPPLQVLSPNMIISQLRMAMREYLQSTVAIDTDAMQVCMGLWSRVVPSKIIVSELWTYNIWGYAWGNIYRELSPLTQMRSSLVYESSSNPKNSLDSNY